MLLMCVLKDGLRESGFRGEYVSESLLYDGLLDLLPWSSMPAVRSIDGREVGA